jgi:hypothetical protein
VALKRSNAETVDVVSSNRKVVLDVDLTKADHKVVGADLTNADGKVVDLDLTKSDSKIIEVDLTELDGKPTDRAAVTFETIKVKLKVLGAQLSMSAESPSQSTAITTLMLTGASCTVAGVAVGIGAAVWLALLVGLVPIGLYLLLRMLPRRTQ